jgi:hypothetical protein
VNKKTLKKEEELISRIRAYREEFKSSLNEKFLLERDQRHREGEVFFKGYWVPKELVLKIQKELTKRGRIVFFETHLLIFCITSFFMLLWIVFNKMLLP